MKKDAFKQLISNKKKAIIIFSSTYFISFIIFVLYKTELEPLLYAFAVSLSFLLAFLLADFIKQKKRNEKLNEAIDNALVDLSALNDLNEYDDIKYREIINILYERILYLNNKITSYKKNAQEYYTMWVHQIKTPVAVMKLKIGETDSELSTELFRIEQYLDMLLAYLRLDSDSNDLVIKEYPLDDILKETIRKYAPQFILRKIKLDFKPSDITIVTDKKWFSLIFEQFLSNAVKYTQKGCVTVTVMDDMLIVSDTGIGIAPEDLPRIFENGYTGLNGRQERHSSGLGLYLAKSAADKLSLSVYAESEINRGSKFFLSLPNNTLKGID